jgi:hypothetical protein
MKDVQTAGPKTAIQTHSPRLGMPGGLLSCPYTSQNKASLNPVQEPEN